MDAVVLDLDLACHSRPLVTDRVGAALFINAAANLSSANTFFIGELLFLLWVVVASITLMIRVGAPSPSLARAEVAVARP